MSDMTLESALNTFFETKMRSMFTAIPARILQVRDEEELRVDVQPLVNMVFSDFEDTVEWPTLLHVPVQFPSSSSSAFTFPLHQGDVVMLIFSQRCLDVFKGGDGTPQPPSDYRVFDKRDAVAIPGVWPFGMSVNKKNKHTLPHSLSDAVIAHNLGTPLECEVRLKASGKVEINGGSVEISPSTKIEGNLNTLGAVTVGTGATGSFTTPLGQVVTVTDGIVTNIF